MEKEKVHMVIYGNGKNNFPLPNAEVAQLVEFLPSKHFVSVQVRGSGPVIAG